MNQELNITQPRQPVVVTGALGFIGRRTVDLLLELGTQRIIAFDLPGLAKPGSWDDRVELVSGDISRADDVDRAMAGAGSVIHLAAMVGDWIPLSDHERVTLRGSRHVFEAALKNDTRVVLSSSIVVYGDRLTRGACPEEKPWGAPVGPYSSCKQEQERLAWCYHRNRGMALAVVRPANVYGPGSKPWVHDVVEVLRSGPAGLVSGGDFNAALVHVDNVAQLLLLAATREQALGQVFNGGDGSTTTWQQYFGDLAQVLGVSPPRSLPRWIMHPAATVIESVWKLLRLTRRPPLTREALNLVSAETVIPIEKARRELGYEPCVRYQEGMRQVEAYVRRELMP